MQQAEPAPLADAAARSILEPYVEGVGEMEALVLRNRFAQLGDANVREALPDTDWCHYYFALKEGTYCYRARQGESFEIRRFSPLVDRPTAALVSQALADSAVMDLVFIEEEITADNLVCGSFFVRQILREREELAGVGFDSFPYQPRGVTVDGIACEIDGARTAISDHPQYEGASFRLWDVARSGEQRYLVIARDGDETHWLELYELRGDHLLLRGSLTPEHVGVSQPGANGG